MKDTPRFGSPRTAPIAQYTQDELVIVGKALDALVDQAADLAMAAARNSLAASDGEPFRGTFAQLEAIHDLVGGVVGIQEYRDTVAKTDTIRRKLGIG